jgi:hypothetical protein
VTLTWGMLILGAMILIGLPVAVVLLNRWRRNAGWWLVSAVVALMIIGNAAERLITGTSPLL